jgi:hypothetical protein
MSQPISTGASTPFAPSTTDTSSSFSSKFSNALAPKKSSDTPSNVWDSTPKVKNNDLAEHWKARDDTTRSNE